MENTNEKFQIKSLFKGCLTVPNLLSTLRIIMVPFIAVAFIKGNKTLGVAILICSGLTDAFDGKIARRFNQISELGKILDPIADKLTMITLAIIMLYFFTRADDPYIKAAGYVFIVFLAKEGIFVLVGAFMLAVGVKTGPAELYGKIATCTFYVVMITLLLLGRDVGVLPFAVIPDKVTLVLVCVSAVCTVVALVSYVPGTYKLLKDRFSKEK